MFVDDLRRHVGKFYGKYSGEVTAIEDEDRLARIMVKVPTIFGPDLEVQARPCLPFGHFYVPKVGTKVWVEFEAGDRQYPIWVGTWYPSDTTPESAAVDPPESRVIHTPSGHTIELHDQDGEEKILVKHKQGSFISIDKEGSVLIANQKGSHLYLDAKDERVTLMEQHGNLVVMSDDGTAMVGKDGVTLQLKGDTAHVIATKVVLEAQSVAAGAGASEPTVLGQTFMNMWNQFITHTHASAMGPTGPALPPAPMLPIHLTSALMVK